MGVDRDAAAVVAHRDPAVAAELQLDSRRMAGDGLVHRVVERFRGEVMQRPLVGAADIHPGAPAHRFEPFEDLDVLGGVAIVELAREIVEEIRHGAGLYGRAKPAQAGCSISFNRW